MSRFPMPIPHGWYFVSYSEDLVPGESKPLHYFDTELVLFRTEKGEPVLMEAYCPHMGAHLGHGIHENTGQKEILFPVRSMVGHLIKKDLL